MISNAPHKIHSNITDFENYFDHNFYQDIKQIYAGKKFSPKPGLKPLILIIAPLSGSGKDTILDELVSRNVLRHVVTATSRK